MFRNISKLTIRLLNATCSEKASPSSDESLHYLPALSTSQGYHPLRSAIDRDNTPLDVEVSWTLADPEDLKYQPCLEDELHVCSHDSPLELWSRYPLWALLGVTNGSDQLKEGGFDLLQLRNTSCVMKLPRWVLEGCHISLYCTHTSRRIVSAVYSTLNPELVIPPFQTGRGNGLVGLSVASFSAASSQGEGKRDARPPTTETSEGTTNENTSPIEIAVGYGVAVKLVCSKAVFGASNPEEAIQDLQERAFLAFVDDFPASIPSAGFHHRPYVPKVPVAPAECAVPLKHCVVSTANPNDDPTVVGDVLVFDCAMINSHHLGTSTECKKKRYVGLFIQEPFVTEPHCVAVSDFFLTPMTNESSSPQSTATWEQFPPFGARGTITIRPSTRRIRVGDLVTVEWNIDPDSLPNTNPAPDVTTNCPLSPLDRLVLFPYSRSDHLSSLLSAPCETMSDRTGVAAYRGVATFVAPVDGRFDIAYVPFLVPGGTPLLQTTLSEGIYIEVPPVEIKVAGHEVPGPGGFSTLAVTAEGVRPPPPYLQDDLQRQVRQLFPSSKSASLKISTIPDNVAIFNIQGELVTQLKVPVLHDDFSSCLENSEESEAEQQSAKTRQFQLRLDGTELRPLQGPASAVYRWGHLQHAIGGSGEIRRTPFHFDSEDVNPFAESLAMRNAGVSAGDNHSGSTSHPSSVIQSPYSKLPRVHLTTHRLIQNPYDPLQVRLSVFPVLTTSAAEVATLLSGAILAVSHCSSVDDPHSNNNNGQKGRKNTSWYVSSDGDDPSQLPALSSEYVKTFPPGAFTNCRYVHHDFPPLQSSFFASPPSASLLKNRSNDNQTPCAGSLIQWFQIRFYCPLHSVKRQVGPLDLAAAPFSYRAVAECTVEVHFVDERVASGLGLYRMKTPRLEGNLPPPDAFLPAECCNLLGAFDEISTAAALILPEAAQTNGGGETPAKTPMENLIVKQQESPGRQYHHRSPATGATGSSSRVNAFEAARNFVCPRTSILKYTETPAKGALICSTHITVVDTVVVTLHLLEGAVPIPDSDSDPQQDDCILLIDDTFRSIMASTSFRAAVANRTSGSNASTATIALTPVSMPGVYYAVWFSPVTNTMLLVSPPIKITPAPQYPHLPVREFLLNPEFLSQLGRKKPDETKEQCHGDSRLPRLKALLIGCSYFGKSCEICGPVNDVERLGSVLLNSWKKSFSALYPAQQKDEESKAATSPSFESWVKVTEIHELGTVPPTCRNIRIALQNFVESVEPGDNVVFFLAGYGTTLPDFSLETVRGEKNKIKDDDSFGRVFLPTDFDFSHRVIPMQEFSEKIAEISDIVGQSGRVTCLFDVGFSTPTVADVCAQRGLWIEGTERHTFLPEIGGGEELAQGAESDFYLYQSQFNAQHLRVSPARSLALKGTTYRNQQCTWAPPDGLVRQWQNREDGGRDRRTKGRYFVPPVGRTSALVGFTFAQRHLTSLASGRRGQTFSQLAPFVSSQKSFESRGTKVVNRSNIVVLDAGRAVVWERFHNGVSSGVFTSSLCDVLVDLFHLRTAPLLVPPSSKGTDGVATVSSTTSLTFSLSALSFCQSPYFPYSPVTLGLTEGEQAALHVVTSAIREKTQQEGASDGKEAQEESKADLSGMNMSPSWRQLHFWLLRKVHDSPYRAQLPLLSVSSEALWDQPMTLLPPPL